MADLARDRVPLKTATDFTDLSRIVQNETQERLSVSIQVSTLPDFGGADGGLKAAAKRGLLSLLAALALAAGLACGGSSPSVAPAPTSGASATAVAPTQAAATVTTPAITPTPKVAVGAKDFPADQAQVLQQIFDRTSDLRGLAAKGPVAMKLINRNDAANYLITTIKEDDKKIIALHQEVYRLLGLIPEDGDILQLQVALLKALVLGFYDPDVKTLFVIEDLGATSAVSRSTVAHELTHALQDQYYDINAVEKRVQNDWDAESAYTDVLEGDARNSENAYTGRFFSQSDFAEQLRSFATLPSPGVTIPDAIRRELDTPYTDGLRFVRNVSPRLQNGVDSLFTNLPKTTEQILHPQKYIDGEGPKVVDLKPVQDALGPGWREMGSSTLGEFTWQNILLLGVSDLRSAQNGADGWGGDRWNLYGRDDGGRLMEIGVSWDSVDQAKKFWSAFVGSLNGRSGGRLRADPNAASVSWDQGGKQWRAAIAGDTVTILVSNNAAATRAAAAVLGLP